MPLKSSLVLLLILLLGCNGPDESATSAPDAFRGPLEIIVPPDEHGNFPPDLWVACRPIGGAFFQISDLDEIVPLDGADPGAVAEAIEPALNNGEDAWPVPQENWLILRETEDEIILVHDDAEEPEPRAGGLSFIRVKRVDGEWVSDEGASWSGPYGPSGSSCPLYYPTPDGLNAVDWWLDPDAPPDKSAVTLAVLVQEQNCVSMQEVGDRLIGPQVVMTEDALRIAFAAEPPPGNQLCPGNPITPVTVELPEPLGDREIIEGLALGIDLEDYLP